MVPLQGSPVSIVQQGLEPGAARCCGSANSQAAASRHENLGPKERDARRVGFNLRHVRGAHALDAQGQDDAEGGGALGRPVQPPVLHVEPAVLGF